MRNACELLRQKEFDLVRIRKETEALRIVAALLCDEEEARTGIEEETCATSELQRTGTDGFLSSARGAFALSKAETNTSRPFLLPKLTASGSNYWQWLREKTRRILDSVHGPARRWWYGVASGILVMIAIGVYDAHRIDQEAVTPAPARVTATAPPRTSSASETASDRLRLIVHSTKPSAQKRSANQPRI